MPKVGLYELGAALTWGSSLSYFGVCSQTAVLWLGAEYSRPLRLHSGGEATL